MVDDQIILSRLHNKVLSAVNVFMADPQSVYTAGSVSVQPFDEDSEPVEISIRNWGAYKILSASGHQARFTAEQTFLVGADILQAELPAIYLPDNKRYLTVSGKNIIVGDCFLPKYGVDRGRFGGEGFSGKDAVIGTIKVSEERLPEISPDLISSFQSLLAAVNLSDSAISYSQLPKTGYQQHSFSLPLLEIESFGVIRIDNMSIAGNILITSDTLVEVSASAQLQDVVISAPYIVVKSGFSGNVQLVASKSIRIEDDVKLLLPSSIVLLETEPSTDVQHIHAIEVGEGSTVAGILLLKSARGQNNRARIIIGENATVYGQVYSDNFMEHKGTVYGSIYTNKFYRSSQSNTYYNLLSNSVTDISKLPKEFIGASVFDENLPMDIIKPLY